MAGIPPAQALRNIAFLAEMEEDAAAEDDLMIAQ